MNEQRNKARKIGMERGVSRMRDRVKDGRRKRMRERKVVLELHNRV